MSRRSSLFGVGIVDSSALPAWADYTALPAGNFIEFTTNTPQDVGMVGATLANWCGGAFVPDYGARGAVCYQGGGEHNTWTDSKIDGSPGQGGVYVLDCDARAYVRKCYPLADNNGNAQDPLPAGSGTYSGSPTDDWGAYADGSPQSKHTYNSISYMPAAWGGGSSGSLIRVSHTGGMSSTRFAAAGGVGQQIGYAATWRFDLSKSRHSVADPGIYKLTGSSYYDFGSGEASNLNESPHACIDHTRQGWWSTNRGDVSPNAGSRMVFTSKTGVISAPQGPAFGTTYMGLHHFADDDIIVRITDTNYDQGAVVTEWAVYVWQAGTNNAWVSAPINRQTITDVFPVGGQRPGILKYPYMGENRPQWCSILGCFVMLDTFYPYNVGTPNASTQKSTTIRVWKITPPPAGQRFTGTWQFTYEYVTAKAGTEATNFMHFFNGDSSFQSDSACINQAYGRLVEVPSLRALAWTRDESKKGQLIRLQGM
jgi:hypothetical protein